MADQLLFILCLLMIAFGLLRYAVALKREETNIGLHLLWVPGAAFFYAVSMTVWLLLT